MIVEHLGCEVPHYLQLSLARKSPRTENHQSHNPNTACGHVDIWSRGTDGPPEQNVDLAPLILLHLDLSSTRGDIFQRYRRDTIHQSLVKLPFGHKKGSHGTFVTPILASFSI